MLKKISFLLASVCLCGAAFAAPNANKVFQNSFCASLSGEGKQCSALIDKFKGTCQVQTSMNKNSATLKTTKKFGKKSEVKTTFEYAIAGKNGSGKHLVISNIKIDCKGAECTSTLQPMISMVMGGYPFRFGSVYGIPLDDAAAIAQSGKDGVAGWLLLKAMQGDRSATQSVMVLSYLSGFAEGLCKDEEKERQEKERLAREKAKQEEEERLAREAEEEEERLMMQAAEHEEEAEWERQEQERLAREEAERQEQERLAREEAERLERERLAREEAERLERERLAREEAERLERERLAREEERKENERLAREAKEQARQDRLAREQEKREMERLANMKGAVKIASVKSISITNEKNSLLLDEKAFSDYLKDEKNKIKQIYQDFLDSGKDVETAIKFYLTVNTKTGRIEKIEDHSKSEEMSKRPHKILFKKLSDYMVANWKFETDKKRGTATIEFPIKFVKE